MLERAGMGGQRRRMSKPKALKRRTMRCLVKVIVSCSSSSILAKRHAPAIAYAAKDCESFLKTFVEAMDTPAPGVGRCSTISGIVGLEDAAHEGKTELGHRGFHFGWSIEPDVSKHAICGFRHGQYALATEKAEAILQRSLV